LTGKEPSLAGVLAKFIVGILMLYMLYIVLGSIAPAIAPGGGEGDVAPPEGFYEPVSLEPADPELVEAVVAYINELRAEHGVPPVSVHVTGVAEARAVDMVENRYFGHCRPDGTPYYAVYSGMGGVFFPEENIGLTVATRGVLNVDPVAEALDHVYSMVYEDEESDWGHRDSLLDPTNNMVDVAVSYDGKMYIVEIILEKAWINWTAPPTYEDGRVYLEGYIAMEGSRLKGVTVYRSEKPQVLQWPVRNGVTFTCSSLDPGTPVAVVSPRPAPGIATEVIVADTWVTGEDWFRVAFTYTIPPGEGYYYYVIVWVENTLGVEHPYNPDRYANAVPALLLVLGEGGGG